MEKSPEFKIQDVKLSDASSAPKLIVEVENRGGRALIKNTEVGVDYDRDENMQSLEDLRGSIDSKGALSELHKRGENEICSFEPGEVMQFNFVPHFLEDDGEWRLYNPISGLTLFIYTVEYGEKSDSVNFYQKPLEVAEAGGSQPET